MPGLLSRLFSPKRAKTSAATGGHASSETSPAVSGFDPGNWRDAKARGGRYATAVDHMESHSYQVTGAADMWLLNVNQCVTDPREFVRNLASHRAMTMRIEQPALELIEELDRLADVERRSPTLHARIRLARARADWAREANGILLRHLIEARRAAGQEGSVDPEVRASLSQPMAEDALAALLKLQPGSFTPRSVLK